MQPEKVKAITRPTIFGSCFGVSHLHTRTVPKCYRPCFFNVLLSQLRVLPFPSSTFFYLSIVIFLLTCEMRIRSSVRNNGVLTRGSNAHLTYGLFPKQSQIYSCRKTIVIRSNPYLGNKKIRKSCLTLKVNVFAGIVFKPSYYEVAAHHIRPCTWGFPLYIVSSVYR